mmetsp:Transcript_11789/g.25989  ORF Transcript_11789/g.25989 Transcript_11789/m.25989 type:complete len:203 (-) Transcript_11789:3180-3788(-)
MEAPMKPRKSQPTSQILHLQKMQLMQLLPMPLYQWMGKPKRQSREQERNTKPNWQKRQMPQEVILNQQLKRQPPPPRTAPPTILPKARQHLRLRLVLCLWRCLLQQRSQLPSPLRVSLCLSRPSLKQKLLPTLLPLLLLLLPLPVPLPPLPLLQQLSKLQQALLLVQVHQRLLLQCSLFLHQDSLGLTRLLVSVTVEWMLPV